MVNEESLIIEVAYATSLKQTIVPLAVRPGTTLHEAILASGILELYPEINLTDQAVGVFGHVKKLTELAQSGDRIEIYRPLLLDPKEARRKRLARS